MARASNSSCHAAGALCDDGRYVPPDLGLERVGALIQIIENGLIKVGRDERHAQMCILL